MTNSQIFKQAHKLTKIAKREASLNREKFSYQVTFSFYLKDITNSQPQKVTVYTGKKQVNIECAMIGDYVKPVDSDKLKDFVNSALFPILLFVPYFVYLAIMAYDYF